MNEEQLKTRVIVVQASGNAFFQDFYTSNHLLAQVQFGEGNAEALRADPAVSVTWISLIDREGDEVDALTELYIGDMLADQVHVVSQG